ncbi:ribonuclease P protein component [Sandarakinorhabdus oryzae]|uniref:ribonuclease P protein component n=1 Tax=Sandarakinorhabdus oryzae TaxID=2675220 RepID=UPI0012E1D588|nr:ribonuclease P protein component [Sandarakinorhabdus oryzae]
MRAPETIRQRRDFLAANQGRRVPSAGFVLLVRQRDDGSEAMRAGFTVTKKIGNSVTRNRLKRRLREIVRLTLPDHGHPGADHVLIGREAGLTRDFATLRADLERALAKAHLPPQPPKDGARR